MYAFLVYGMVAALVAHGIAYLWPERWLLQPSQQLVVGGMQGRRQAASWTMVVAGPACLLGLIEVIDGRLTNQLSHAEKALLVLAVAGSALLGVVLARYRLAMWAGEAAWPAVPGTIFKTEVPASVKLTDHEFYLIVIYQYQVSGESYSGETRFSFGSPALADQYAYRLRTGPVQVKYNPRQPDKSVLFIP